MQIFHKMQFICIAIIILSVSIVSQAQNETNYWVYETIETKDAYEIIRTNALDNTVETVTNIPKTPDFNLRSIMPEEELAEAEHWYTGTISSPVGASIPDHFEYPPNASIPHIEPSPDGSKVAVTIRYSQCNGQLFFKCFGISQVIIVDGSTGEASILWTLPHVAKSEFFPYCFTPFIYTPSGVDTGIVEIRWTPNQASIVAMIYYDHYGYPPDTPLVLIPINTPQNAFTAGSGESGWTISPDSKQIVSISRDCDSPTRENDIVRITTFDLESNQHSYQDYPQSPDTSDLGMLFNPVFLQNRLIFPVEETNPHVAATGAIYSLGQLDPNQVNSMSLINGSIDSIRQMLTSPSGEFVIVEDRDGLLWRFQLEDEDFLLLQITKTPIIYWQFASDEELIIQVEGHSQFSVVNIPDITS